MWNRMLWLPLCLLLPAFAHAQEEQPDAQQMLREAVALIQEGSYRLAIGNKLDPLIRDFEKRYEGTGKRIYGARTTEESLYYLLEVAAAIEEGVEKTKNDPSLEKVEVGGPLSVELATDGVGGATQNAMVIGPAWGDALFMKGSALVSLNAKAEAEQVLAEALKLSPMNSMYLSEYTYIFISNKEFEKGLEWATKAEQAAQFSPEGLKKEELGRAKRNMGYALIELGRLDEAEKKYKEALKLDKNDQKAKHELDYIRQLRSEQGGG